VEAERLVTAVGVQRLRAAEHRRQRLQRDAHHVDVRLATGERAAGGLRVKTQLLRPRAGGAEAVAHDPRPEPAGRAELGDLFKEVVVGVEEERQARREVVDVQLPGRHASTYANPSASVNASSWAAVEPPRRM
jgi:hypothetical protein